ncbi:hypothetical protein [Campylobacter sp. 7477a]|uniref:hypothetical protein n=1 Tax=Campylobacter sp. 7477a TaxID=2735741 RepID=UPI003014839B|nr:hypothetical protein [Campylobacter sp. 7477a]
MTANVEALQMQINELNNKVDLILFELMRNKRQCLSIKQAAEILRISYAGVYKKAVINHALEPDKEMFLKDGKWFITYSGLSRLKEMVW